MRSPTQSWEPFRRTKQKFWNKQYDCVKNSIKGLISGLDQAEETASKVKDRAFETIQ